MGAEPPNIKNFWNRLSPECITNVKYTIDHIWNTKHHTKEIQELKNPYQNIADLIYFLVNCFCLFVFLVIFQHFSKKKSFTHFFFRLKMFWNVYSIKLMVGSYWGGEGGSADRYLGQRPQNIRKEESWEKTGLGCILYRQHLHLRIIPVNNLESFHNDWQCVTAIGIS